MNGRFSNQFENTPVKHSTQITIIVQTNVKTFNEKG